jgi:hypothetical protein
MINRAGKLGLHKKQLLWNSRDILFLKEHYPTKGAQFVADVLNRSWISVHYKSARLRLYMKGRIRWTPQADAYLRQWHGKRKSSEIAKKLGTSAHAIESRAYVIGLKNRIFRRWEPEEIEYALNSFPRLTHKEVARELGRTEIAIMGFYAKRKKRKHFVHKWTANEKHVIRRLHNKISIKELAVRLHQSEQRLRATTYRMGLGPTTKRGPLYTDQERSFILQNYRTMTYRQLAEKLNRPFGGVIDVAGRLGIKKQKQTA